MALLKLAELQQFLSAGDPAQGAERVKRVLRYLCLGRAAARHWLELISRKLVFERECSPPGSHGRGTGKSGEAGVFATKLTSASCPH